MKSPEERFWAKVEKTDSCWLWTPSQQGQGYGRFWSGERRMSAHRFAYEHFVGPIPLGLDLDHLCRVRNCVNPAHLEPVTRRENLLRGDTLTAMNAAKTHCVNGHPFSGSNLLFDVDGFRRCRTCDRAAGRRAWRKAHQAKAAA